MSFEKPQPSRFTVREKTLDDEPVKYESGDDDSDNDYSNSVIDADKNTTISHKRQMEHCSGKLERRPKLSSAIPSDIDFGSRKCDEKTIIID